MRGAGRPAGRLGRRSRAGRGRCWSLGSLLMSAALVAAGAHADAVRTSTPSRCRSASRSRASAICPPAPAIAGALPPIGAAWRSALVYIGSNIGGALVPLVGDARSPPARRGAPPSPSSAPSLWIAAAAAGAAASAAPRAARGRGRAKRAPAWRWRAPLRERDFWLLFWRAVRLLLLPPRPQHAPGRLPQRPRLLERSSAAGGFSFTLALGIAGKLLAGAARRPPRRAHRR